MQRVAYHIVSLRNSAALLLHVFAVEEDIFNIPAILAISAASKSHQSPVDFSSGLRKLRRQRTSEAFLNLPPEELMDSEPEDQDDIDRVRARGRGQGEDGARGSRTKGREE